MPLPVGVNFFADVGIAYAFAHSNIAGKAVIAILIFGSIFSWSVMVSKIVMIRRARVDTKRFLRRFRTARKPLVIYQNREAYPDSPAYAVYLAGCKELTFHLLGTTEIDDTFATRLAESDKISPVAMSAVRSALEREVDKLTQRLADRKLVDRAKGVLQSSCNMSEEQAYFAIRNASRRRRAPMRLVAEQVIEGTFPMAPGGAGGTEFAGGREAAGGA